MRAKLIRFFCIALAATLCLTTPLSVCASAAITYPQSVTESDAANAIPKAEKIVEALIKKNGGVGAVKKKIYDTFFADGTLNSIFKGVYSSLSENASSLGTLGIDITPAGIAAALVKYPEISSAVSQCATLDEVIKKADSFKWGVKSKSEFSSAVAAMFSPINELLYTLLCGGTYNVGILISVKGDNGYKNAIVPLLKAINCPSVMSQEDYTKKAKANRANMVKALFDMIFSALDKIIEKPVDGLCTVLPSISYFLKNGGLSEAVKTLISPLQVKIAGLFSLGGISKLIENSALLQNSTDLTAVLEKLDISSAMGLSGDFKLAKIDLDAFASCGSVSGGTYTPDKSAAFVTLLRFAVDTVKLNKGSISQIIPEAASAGDTINKFLLKSTDELVTLVIKLLTLSPSGGVLEYNWIYPEFTPSTVEYTPNLTKENYEKVLDGLDDTLNEFLKEFTEKGTLSSMIGSAIYSNKLLTTIVKKLYGTLDSSGAGSLVSMLGADVSVEGTAKSVEAKYPRAAAALRRAGSWDKVGEASVSWGFSDGSRAGFSAALTRVLSPFAPVLKFILAEGEITILDAVTVSGGAGYNTAVIPILEALGCDADSIKTYDEYKRFAGDDVITNITKPIFELLDRLVNKPVYTLTKILPNAVYFLNSDGISQCVKNLLYPVTRLLSTLELTDIMPGEFTNISETLNISSLMKTVLAGGKLPVKLPEPDLNKAASLGTAQTLTSKRTFNGAPAQYTYIEADQPAILVTALRYIVNALKSEENASVLSDALKNGMGDNEMMSMYTANIGEKLGAMTTDEVIEWLYKLLFSETPKSEHVTEDDTPLTIIYQPPKKTSNVTKGVIIGAAIAAALAFIVFLSRFDFGNHRQRRRHLKEKKRRLKKELKSHMHRYDPSYTGEDSSFNGSTSDKDAEKLAEYARKAEEAERRRAEAREKNDVAVAAKADREYVKLAVRRDKAARRAERQSRKADKFYRQALKESENKRR